MKAALTTRHLIDRLCSFDTTSSRSNLDLIHFVANYLDDLGIASTLIHDGTGAKANLFATVGPEIDGGVVLSGHTDVVPAERQDWNCDPFKVTEKDGKLFGRGVADMKGFIAAALAMAPAFKSARMTVPVHYAFSYDEEVGCLGVHGILDHMKGSATRPMAVIVGEPTRMKVVNAHKGCSRFSTHLTGLEGHSSAPHLGVNSIFHGAGIVCFIESLAAEYRETDLDDRYCPPYTTINVGTISGGSAPNVIARETRLSWEIRALKEAHRQDIFARVEGYINGAVLPKMRESFQGARVDTTVTGSGVGLVAGDCNPAEALALDLVGGNHTHAVSYGTEAGLFQNIGIPTVICGPGDIEQAHKPDEWIELGQIQACDDFMQRLLARLSSNNPYTSV